MTELEELFKRVLKHFLFFSPTEDNTAKLSLKPELDWIITEIHPNQQHIMIAGKFQIVFQAWEHYRHVQQMEKLQYADMNQNKR